MHNSQTVFFDRQIYCGLPTMVTLPAVKSFLNEHPYFLFFFYESCVDISWKRQFLKAHVFWPQVYYFIFEHFVGATNQDMLLLPCTATNQIDHPKSCIKRCMILYCKIHSKLELNPLIELSYFNTCLLVATNQDILLFKLLSFWEVPLTRTCY